MRNSDQINRDTSHLRGNVRVLARSVERVTPKNRTRPYSTTTAIPQQNHHQDPSPGTDSDSDSKTLHQNIAPNRSFIIAPIIDTNSMSFGANVKKNSHIEPPTYNQSPLLGLQTAQHMTIQIPASSPRNNTSTRRHEPTSPATPIPLQSTKNLHALHLTKHLSRTANKCLLISKHSAASNHYKKTSIFQLPKTYITRFKRREFAIGIGVILILSVTGYVSFDTWKTNAAVRQSLSPTASISSSDTSNKNVPSSGGEGQDKTPLPKNALANYKVSPELPRAIYIQKLGVAARLLPMGVNNDSSLQAPTNINDAGWYTGSAKPGQTGAIVVDGHASQTGTNYGLFSKLDTLTNGDQLIIEKGDGTKITYKVVHTEIDLESSVDMNKLMIPYGTATQGVNLITCAGEWTKDGKTLDHRVLVFTVPVRS